MTSITIDGPAGAGKTTVAKALSEKLGYIYFNTGAIYRAVAFNYLKSPFNIENTELLTKLLDNMNLTLKYENGVQQVLLSGVNVTNGLFNPDIDSYSSSLSQHKLIRQYAVHLQREFASGQNIVLEGRDTGSNVLPAAEFKFFLTASAEVRAKRRLKQYLISGGENSKISFNHILEDIIKRDKQDSERLISPLIVPQGATVIDSEHMTAEEVVEFMLGIIKGK